MPHCMTSVKVPAGPRALQQTLSTLVFMVPLLQFSGVRDMFYLTGNIFGSVSIVIGVMALFVG